MTLIWNDETLSPALREMVEEALSRTLRREGLWSEGEISLSLVSAEEIRALNREYRHVDAVTDVLSFPQYESLEEIRERDYLFLGDIVLNLDRVEEQARELGHSFERELLYLSLHSLYHLLGFDHQTENEKKEMRQREEAALKDLRGDLV